MKYFLRIKFIVFIGLFLTIAVNAQDSNSFDDLSTDSLLTLAGQYYTSNKIDTALYCIDLARDKFKSRKNWEGYIQTWNFESKLYYLLKRYKEYEEVAFKAYKESTKYLKQNDKNGITALSNLSGHYYVIGNYEKAIEITKKVIALSNKYNTSKTEIAKHYNNLGNSYRFLGENQRAINYYRKSLEIIKDTLPEVSVFTNAYQSIGRVFRSKNQIDSTIYYFEKAEQILKPVKSENIKLTDRKINNFLILAELWNENNNSKKTNFYLKESVKLATNEYFQVFIYETKGKIFNSNGKYQDAINALSKSEAIANKNNKRNNPPIKAKRLIQLAIAYNSLHELNNALTAYQQAIQVLSPGFNNSDVYKNPSKNNIFDKVDALTIIDGKAQIFQRLYTQSKNIKELEAAHENFLLAIQIVQDIRKGIITAKSKKTLSKKTIAIYERAIQTALELYVLTKKENYKEKALVLAENNKALLLLESINEQSAKNFSEIPDSLLVEEKEINLDLAFLQKTLLEEEAKGNTSKNTKDQIFNLNQQLDLLTSDFEKNYPRYFELKYKNTPIDLKTIQQNLAIENSALIEYFVGEKAIYVFVVSKDKLDIEIIDDPILVNTAIQQLRPILNQPPGSIDPKKEFAQFTNAAFELYSTLVQPALNKLPKNIQHLTIVSDDLLNYIPFDILLSEKADLNQPGYSPDHLQYLMEDYVINYHYSATLLHKSQTRKKQNYTKDFIGFAPQFKDSEYIASRSCTTDELYSLKCSNDEVSNISNLLDGEARLDIQATKSVFENEAPAYRIIHLATHACIDENNSNLNKIFLTDDYLSNSDLYNLKLNTELAVLSACNTGSGELIKGEGVMNLARGFINAGCSSTLMSMWSVDDCATSDIMYRFYEGLHTGLKKDQALKSAKLSYLNEVGKTKMHPYFWAAFVPFGDMEAIEFKQNSNWLYYLAPLGLLLFGFLFFWRRKA